MLTTLFRHIEGGVTFQPDEVIFRAGDPGSAMYAVQEGEVDLVLGDEVIETAKENDIFGELALLAHSHRTATARARTACRVVAVDEDAFIRQTKLNPFFALEVMRLLARRLVNTDRALLALVQQAMSEPEA